MLSCRARCVQLVARRYQHGLNQPSGTTGIEHALKAKQQGRQHQQDFKDYKCIEYLHFNKYSFYDTEVSPISDLCLNVFRL